MQPSNFYCFQHHKTEEVALATASLSSVEVVALLIMSISGVSAWWARNILGDAPKVRLFATIGTLSAIFLVWSTW